MTHRIAALSFGLFLGAILWQVAAACAAPPGSSTSFALTLTSVTKVKGDGDLVAEQAQWTPTATWHADAGTLELADGRKVETR